MFELRIYCGIRRIGGNIYINHLFDVVLLVVGSAAVGLNGTHRTFFRRSRHFERDFAGIYLEKLSHTTINGPRKAENELWGKTVRNRKIRNRNRRNVRDRRG